MRAIGSAVVTVFATVMLGLGAAQASQSTPGAAAITVEKAKEIALSQVRGTVEEAELEVRDGKHVWEVEVDLGNGEDRDVIIDAASGEVLSVEG